jgi:predicted Fe-Mo cluster-binding NifX family protein
MRVAIPLSGDDISPRFGSNAQFRVATVANGHVQSEEVRDTGNLCPHEFPEFLSSLGVGKVICGGIHRRFRDALEQRGIEVTWGVFGSAADALRAFREGTLRRDQFVCREHPGRHGRG